MWLYHLVTCGEACRSICDALITLFKFQIRDLRAISVILSLLYICRPCVYIHMQEYIDKILNPMDVFIVRSS